MQLNSITFGKTEARDKNLSLSVLLGFPTARWQQKKCRKRVEYIYMSNIEFARIHFCHIGQTLMHSNMFSPGEIIITLRSSRADTCFCSSTYSCFTLCQHQGLFFLFLFFCLQRRLTLQISLCCFNSHSASSHHFISWPIIKMCPLNIVQEGSAGQTSLPPPTTTNPPTRSLCFVVLVL